MFAFHILVAYMHRIFNETKKCFTPRQNFLIDAFDQIYKPETCIYDYLDLNLQRFIDWILLRIFKEFHIIAKMFILGKCFSNINKIP